VVGVLVERVEVGLPLRPMRPRRLLPVTVTRLPYRGEDLEATLKVATLYARYWPGWSRVLILGCAVFHGALALALVLFPYDQLLTEGTTPVFALASRYLWATAFAVGAVGISAAMRWTKPWLHGVVWVGVTFLFGAWFTPLIAAVLDGGGSPLAAVVWLFLYGMFFGGAITDSLNQR
jgi:hypothetical protein